MTKNERKIYVYSKTGLICEFTDYEGFLEWARQKNSYSFGHRFCFEFVKDRYSLLEYVCVEYRVLTGQFIPISHSQLVADIEYYKKQYWRKYYAHYSRYCQKPRFRIDPIPRTGKYKNTIRGYYRHIHTFPEYRQWEEYASVCKEYQIHCKCRRSIHNLPNSWSDIGNSDNRVRSWKRTKKQKQWQ